MDGTWSLIVRDEHRLRLFENRLMRRIFEPKRGEVARGWTRLHNVKFHNLYASPNIFRVIKSSRMRWAAHVARMGAIINAYGISVSKTDRKRPLGNIGVDRKILE
jgi:hypothetical protein